jgi:hypothetical protein
LADEIRSIALSRLHNAVYDQVPSFEAEVVSRFNAVVDSHLLNEVGRDLPALENKLSPVDLTRAQAHAVATWSEAADLLRPLWLFYSKLAELNGDPVGPGGADDLSTNLTLAARLGPVPDMGTARSAATRFASIAVGSDAARGYGEIGVFVVPVISGYPLNAIDFGRRLEDP